MFKTLLALPLLVSTASAGDLSVMQKEMFSPTVQVNQNCSGSIVSSNRNVETGKVTTVILTAGHCVEGSEGKEFEIRIPHFNENNALVSEDVEKATVLGKWFKGDLALIELKDTDKYFSDVVKLAPKDFTPKMGQDVWSVGYPYGLTETVTEGMFGSRMDLAYDGVTSKEYFRATPPIAGGNSGGPVFRLTEDGHYEQVGVNVMASQQDDFITLSIPVDQIYDYLHVAVPEAVDGK